MKKDILKEIRQSLKTEKTHDTTQDSFGKSMAEFLNTKEVRQLLTKRNETLQLFCHYASSMGAILCNSPPSYEVNLEKSGLSIYRNGKKEETYRFPLKGEDLTKALGYGGEFHDSSCGDYTFKPTVKEYLSELEEKIRRLI